MKHSEGSMKYKIEDRLLDDKLSEEEIKERIDLYLESYRTHLLNLPNLDIARQECISGANRINRYGLKSCEELDISVKVGDICYIDYGLAYLNESGYQHFGLVISIDNYKIFVLPMSSKPSLIHQAINAPDKGQIRKRHLFYIGQPEGMSRESVLFLNDRKYINSARIIDVKASIDVDSDLFKAILSHVIS